MGAQPLNCRCASGSSEVVSWPDSVSRSTMEQCLASYNYYSNNCGTWCGFPSSEECYEFYIIDSGSTCHLDGGYYVFNLTGHYCE